MLEDCAWRKGGPEEPESAKRTPRQDPVSCESCRKKKLKCDRQRPCSSCVTRRLTCTFRADPSVNAVRHRKLEDLRKQNRVVLQRHDNVLPRGPDSGAHPCQNCRESLVTADWLEHIHMGDRVPAALSPQLRAELDERSPKQYQREVPSGKLLSIQQSSWTPNENPATIDLIHFLPSESDTADLFAYFCRYISYLYHIIIPHVVEGQIYEVYRSVERGSPVNRSHIALLFAITGSSLTLQCSIESSAHAARCIQQFSFLTGAALTQSDYSSYPTIEGLQAALIIFHNTSNMHLSTRVTGFFEVGPIVSQAKNMMLHLVDTPRAIKERETQRIDLAELEVRRRLWWDIASFDWCLAFLSGPQEWTYLVNPAFIHTEKPSNIDDTAIGRTSPQPSTTPTSMSFFLERLKFAETCRNIVDAMSHEQLSGTEVDYSKILEFDHRIQQAQLDAPDFLRLDSNSRRRFAALYEERPTLAWQRSLLQQGYYSRLCRLHRPFFIRGARDPRYSYSYVAGLNAARKVLEIQRIMDEEEPRLTPSSSVIWSIMHHVFMAAVMLLLDVCYNPDDILAEKRKKEVLDACRMLSKAQKSSSLVKEGINAMMGVMQGHYMSGKAGSTTVMNLGVSVLEQSQPQALASVPTPVSESSPQPLYGVEDQTLAQPLAQDHRDLEDVWSEFIDNGANMGFEADDWTGLFSELTQATLPVT
ncbi:hypothetical protein BDV12DRAFT_187551 [Aspergillus spectabilis]